MENKRRRLVADTADDLQHILFGDMDETAQESHDLNEAILPVESPEPEDVGSFSDSDKDSMDEFIVRDTHEDQGHRFIQSYSDRFGEDVGETLNDVIAVFGDLRILDMYSRDASRISTIKSRESRFGAEEMRAELATDEDAVILQTDCSERLQEQLGTAKALEPILAFETEDVEAMGKFEKEWEIEARWLYCVLRARAVQRSLSKSDWSLWSPCDQSDYEVDVKSSSSSMSISEMSPVVDQATIDRIRVFLRDWKGRGFDPHYIWVSMSRAKYLGYLNLDDLLAIQILDESEWTSTVWPKLGRISMKIDDMYGQIEKISEIGEFASETAQAFGESVRVELANLKSELGFLTSADGMTPNLSLVLDDFALSLSVELEPVLKFVLDSQQAKTGTIALEGNAPVRKLRRPPSTITRIVATGLDLLPVLSLSPREIGENLQIGARVHKGPEMGLAPTAPTAAVGGLLVDYLSASVAANAKVRGWFREQLLHRATVSTHPLTTSMDCTSKFYGIRRLCMRPIAEIWGTEVFLAIHSLVQRGELSMDLVIVENGKILREGKIGSTEEVIDEDDEFLTRNVNLAKEAFKSPKGATDLFVCEDVILADLLYHMKPDVVDTNWLASLRLDVGKAIVQKLYKSIKAELCRELLLDSVQVAASKAALEFERIGSMKGYQGATTGGTLESIASSCADRRVLWEVTNRKLRGTHATIMAGVIEKLSNGVRTHVVVINAKGEVAQSIQLDHLLNKWAPKYTADFAKVQALIKTHFPSLVVVGAEDWKSRSLFAELKKCADWVYHEKAQDGTYLDTDASRFLACPEVCLSTVRMNAADPVATATALARFHQNPLAELLLSSSSGGLPNSLHPLQAYITEAVLKQHVQVSSTKLVALCGVDLNDVAGSPSRQILLAHLPGLGQRKARHLLEQTDTTLRGLEAEESRSEKLESVLGKRLGRVVQPFLKLQPQVEKIVQLLVEGHENFSQSSEDESSSSSSSDDSESEQNEDETMEKQTAGNDYGDAGNWDNKTPEDQYAGWSKDEAGNWVKNSDEGDKYAGWTKDENGKWIKTSEALVAEGYFGVPNKLVKAAVPFSFLEMCRFAKECWPVVRELRKDYFAVLGTPIPDSSESSFSELIETMFAAELPAHLKDSEIDLSVLKSATDSLIGDLLVPELHAPFSSMSEAWKSSSNQEIFYACVHENPSDFNLFTVVTATVKEAGRDGVKVSEVGTGIEGPLTKGYSDRSYYVEGDSVLCRIGAIDFAKFSLAFSTEPMSEKETARFHQKYLVSLPGDFEHLTSSKLGKVEPAAGDRTVLKTRRIIKHDSYFEIPHASAVAKLAEAPIGEVIFRPSSSHPGQYFGLIKIKSLADSVDPSREDWIKTFRFSESLSTRVHGKPESVFRLLDNGNDEFEEFDQMKVLFVEKYMLRLQELLSHPKFRPESIDRVSNLVKAKSMAQKGAVAYSFVLDPKRESAGNAILLWTAGDRVYQDPIEISHRGFKWWTKGPYPTLNSLINWWKMGGYKERASLMTEWKEKHAPSDNNWNKKW